MEMVTILRNSIIYSTDNYNLRVFNPMDTSKMSSQQLMISFLFTSN